MLVNDKNFRFTQIPDKTNNANFLNSPKTKKNIFDHFPSFLPDEDFFQNIHPCHTQLCIDP